MKQRYEEDIQVLKMQNQERDRIADKERDKTLKQLENFHER